METLPSTKGVIHKYIRLDFQILDHPSPLSHTLLALSLHPPPKSKTQTLLQKKSTGQSYQKILNKNTKMSPGIEFELFNYTGEMGMDHFGYLSSSLYFISIL